MITALTLLLFGPPEVLPYEEQVLAQLRPVLEATNPEGIKSLGPVTGRRFIGGRFAELSFKKSVLTWPVGQPRLQSLHSISREPLSKNQSTLSVEKLDELARRAFSKIVGPEYTFYKRSASKGTTDYDCFFEVCREGYPIHEVPAGSIQLDTRTGNVISLQPGYLDGPIDKVDGSQTLPTEVLRPKAIDAYFSESPIGIAGVIDMGVRLVRPRTAGYTGPNPNRIVTVEKINPGMFGKKPAARLAYVMHFGWQSAVVDAVTGDCLSVMGMDLGYNFVGDIEGGVWHALSDQSSVGRLRESKVPNSGPFSVVSLLSSNGIAARGAFHSKSRTVTLGYRTYEVKGDLVNTLLKQAGR